MGKKITLPSGASLEITLMPFEEAWELCQTVSGIIENLKIDLSALEIEVARPQDLVAIKGPLCSLLANKEIVAAAKSCFKRCLYNGLKIDGDTFEDRSKRSDFLPVVYYVIFENVSPFFENLVSYLMKRFQNLAASLPQK